MEMETCLILNVRIIEHQKQFSHVFQTTHIWFSTKCHYSSPLPSHLSLSLLIPLFGLKLSWRLSAELTLTITRHIHGTFYTWYKSNIVFPNAMNWRCWVVLPFIYLRTVKSDSSLFLIICFQHLTGVFRTSYTSNTKWNGRDYIFNFLLANTQNL